MPYLNAASHGLPDAAVRRRMIAHLRLEDEIGVPAAEARAAEELAALRPALAGLVGAHADEIAFLDWGTLAWNAAMLSAPVAGRRVLVAPAEWSSNVALLQRLGARIEVMATDGSGRLDVPAIAARIDDDLAAICMPLVSSLTGERLPAEAVGRLARPGTCLFVVDAAQALGQMPVSMPALGADILAAPARKWLRGPRGTGMLAVRRGALGHLAPSRLADDARLSWPDGIAADAPGAGRFERPGFNVALRLGLAAALRICLADEPAIHARIARLADHARRRAAEAGFALAAKGGSGIVTLRLPAGTAADAAARAGAAGFTVKAPTPDCEPLRPPTTVTGDFLRISPHVYNSEAEIDRLLDVLGADAALRTR